MLTTLEPVTIRVELTAHTPLQDVVVGVRIDSLARRRRVGHEHPPAAAARSGASTGRRASTSRSPSLPLLEGVYDLTVALTDHTEIHPYDHWERRIRFEVRQYRVVRRRPRAHPCRVDDQRDEGSSRAVSSRRQPVPNVGSSPARRASSSDGAAASFGRQRVGERLAVDPGVRPGDADRRVERVHAVLAAGGVRRRAQVDDGRPVLSAMNAWPSPSARYMPRRSTSSRSTLSHCPNVGEPTRMSTTTSSTAPVTHVTYLAWPGGTSEKWMPRTTPAAETEQLAWASSRSCPTAAPEPVRLEPLEEHATVVAVLLRA